MNRLFGRRRNRIIAVAVLVPLLVAVGFGLYLASLAGELPWQVDPTRIAPGITPFAGIPGFGSPTLTLVDAPPVAAASPTRIAITPFADIPGFGAPTPAAADATPIAAVGR